MNRRGCRLLVEPRAGFPVLLVESRRERTCICVICVICGRIEVVGTWDDLVIREIRAYRDRAQPGARLAP